MPPSPVSSGMISSIEQLADMRALFDMLIE